MLNTSFENRWGKVQEFDLRTQHEAKEAIKAQITQSPGNPWAITGKFFRRKGPVIERVLTDQDAIDPTLLDTERFLFAGQANLEAEIQSFLDITI